MYALGIVENAYVMYSNVKCSFCEKQKFDTIVINDNIIEEVTDFKYLGYRISEYGSDLEDKLQTYNEINGAIRRHFGKQMNKKQS